MKKKVLFMMIDMNVGGTEKALLNMVSQMPKNEYEITILMLEKNGGFLNSIPSYIQLQYVDNYKEIKDALNMPPRKVAANLFREGKFIKGINLLFFYYFSKVIRNKNYYYQYITMGSRKTKIEYDIAIAYAGPMDFISFFVLEKIRAKKKIQWVHFDVEKIWFDQIYAKKIYSKFEDILVVSKEAKEKLIKAVPVIREKTHVFYNVISPSHIIKQSKDGKGFIDDFSGIRILTVGRLSHEKGQDLAIKILSKLIKEGHYVRWYCIGDGGDREELERLISEYQLEDHFILLGSNTNPYPFMDKCDIYVQPSRYEGYCLTILEAKVFNKPIVATNFNGITEQLKHNQTGIVVNVDEVQLYNGVQSLITNEYLRKKLSNNLRKENNFTTGRKISIN